MQGIFFDSGRSSHGLPETTGDRPGGAGAYRIQPRYPRDLSEETLYGGLYGMK